MGGIKSLNDTDSFSKKFAFEDVLALSMGMTLKNSGGQAETGRGKGGAFLGKAVERILEGRKGCF